MSFSARVKEELVNLPILDPLAASVEIIGMLKFRGEIQITRKTGIPQRLVSLELSNAGVARRAYSLFRFLQLSPLETSYRISPYFEKNKRYRLRLELGSVRQNVLYFDQIEPDFSQQFETFLSTDPGFFGDFVRGTFLMGGYTVNPKNHYHMEWIEKVGDSTVSLMQRIFDRGFHLHNGIAETSKGTKLYLKSSIDIIEVLELMGASRQADWLERIVDQRKVKSDVNRSINFTLANAKKIGKSSFEQIKAIRDVEQRIGLANLEPELQQIARIRLNNEDMSLGEIGQQLPLPLGKSAVYNRMRKIIRLAHSLLEEEGEENRNE
ncbi:MAG TPA: DNA-binding protein WhiA [Thermotogota bacterium]|nr:DNA-binding protein WhiA [Thermotogota bacterium]